MYRYVILCIILVTLPAVARADVLYRVDFENGDTSAAIFSNFEESMGGGLIEAVANPAPDAANSSALVGRCRVPQGYVRAELTSDRMPFEGETLVYRWSYFLPADFFTDADLSWLAVSQLKTWPCEVCDPVYDPAICGGCGGIFDDMSIEDDQWTFRWRAEPDCLEHTEPVVLGQWVRFALEIYWTKEQTGWTRLWMDGELVREEHDIRTLFTSHVSPDCDLNFAVGLYASWSGNKQYLELYIDNIEIEDGPMEQPDAGVPPEDGGSGDGGGAPDAAVPTDGGTDLDGGAGADPVSSGSGGSDGCGCTVAGPDHAVYALLALLPLVALSRRARRRR